MDIKEIIQTINRGRAVLFVGAGFSRGAIGFNKELPVAEELKNMIYESMGKPNDSQKNLSVVADYFLTEYCKDNPKALEDFIKLMKNTFTVTKPEDYHVTLASLPWKRIYTTNYDDVIEEAAKKNNKRIEGKDLEDLSRSRVQQEYYCLHINGRIANLNQETLNKSFKLTSSSYVRPETPIDTLWKQVFKDDIEILPLTVFIGYSLYDIDIEKILFQHNSSIKNKIIFIQNKNIDEMDRHKFEKYGKVYPIGVQEFAGLIESTTPANTEEETSLQCFCELKLIEKTLEPIRDAEIDKFLIQGYITDERIQDETIREPSKAPFLIRRSKIEEALESIKNSETKILVVTGDIGNGKTIFLKQLSIKLAMNRQVFTLEQRGDEFDIKRDIDNIVKLNKNSIIIIDSYTRYPWILEYIKQKPYNELIFIFAARTYDYYRNLQENDYLQSAKQIDIDTLDDGELEYFYDIIECIGGWYLSKDSKAKYNSKSQKMRILSQDCKKELSLILVKVLESETMKNKINKLLDNLFNSPVNKKQVFAICLLNYMDIPISISLLEEILGEHDLSIYANENLKHLINLNLINKGNEISMKSPILSLLILKTYFAKENTQYFLEILHRLMEGVYAYNAPFLNGIKKNLLRFNFIERLLVDEGKIGRIQKYYENLKKEFKQLLNDPQYWLQYAMCFIMYNDLDKAQRMLNTAYDKADSDYDKTKIDNQQARLHLKKASKADTNIKEAITLFSQADKLLTKQNNDSIHKYKIMMDYKEFFDVRSKSFNQEQRNQIIACCKKQLNTLNSITTKSRFKEWKIYEECRDMLEEFVRNFTYKNPT